MTAARPEPLILTALLDAASQARFDRDRQRYFPSRINFIPAHVTLFHHLPGAEQPEVERTLSALCTGQGRSAFATAGLRFLGRGTAYALHMPELATFRGRLVAAWQPWLTAQDRQGWQPHVTIQNKVAAAEAKQLHANLTAAFVPQDGTVDGVRLWRYLDGPWQLLAEYPFGT